MQREFLDQLSVIEHIKLIYGCRKCENNEITTPLKVALKPKPAIPGSIASSSAITYVTNEKFLKGLPEY